MTDSTIGFSPDRRLEFTKVTRPHLIPGWTNRAKIASFFHETMHPYEDRLEDIQRALDYAFSDRVGEGGFLMLAHQGSQLLGALLMLSTGMKGYIPENILLFVTIDPILRGKGVGRQLIERCLAESEGDVKLHVEHENPAKRLYERIGFTTKYAEMRFHK